MGGSDAASPRYIFTHLSLLARLLFPDVDDMVSTCVLFASFEKQKLHILIHILRFLRYRIIHSNAASKPQGRRWPANRA